MTSKTSKINKCREEILSNMCAYAFLAYRWDPRKKQDFDNFEESLNRILEKYIE